MTLSTKMSILVRNVQYLHKYGLLGNVIRCACSAYSSDAPTRTPPKVAVSNDGSTFLCWHPEQKFPYECSQPIPRNESELQEGTSALKVQYLEADRQRYRQDGPTQKELEQMFHTTKHVWKPVPSKKKEMAKKHDRDAL